MKRRAAHGSFPVNPMMTAVFGCLEARGIERDDVLRLWGVRPDELAAGRLSVARGYALWQVLWQVGGRDFAIALARHMTVGDLGLYDYVWRNSPTIGHGIAMGGRFSRLLGDDLEVGLELQGRRAVYWYAAWRPTPVNEVGLAMLSSYARDLLGDQVPCHEVWLRQCDDRLRSTFEEFFRCPVRTGTERDALVFDRDLLRAPMPGADARLFAVLLPVAEQALGALPAIDRLLDQVRGLLRARVADGDLELVDTARLLAVSAPTLRRHLRHCGTTFSALRDEVRKEVALSQLPLNTVTEVAALTGFSDHSGFCKAFRRWTGMTPSQFRRSGVRTAA
ncbi:MAG: AraC family transcriptional regulator ligand-binding domain-containing protein [Myxococcota bacterium]